MNVPFVRVVSLGAPGAIDREAYVTADGLFLADGIALITTEFGKSNHAACAPSVRSRHCSRRLTAKR